MNEKTTHILIDGKPTIKMTFDFDLPFDSLTMSFSGIKEIAASTSGSIDENEIKVNKRVITLDCYLIAESDQINVSFSYFKNGNMFHSETLSKQVKTVEVTGSSPHAPIIFTGDQGMDFFKKRIKKQLFPNVEFKISLQDDLKIEIIGEGKNLFLCLGTLDSSVSKNDLCFSIDETIKELSVPGELINDRFAKQTIALHVLTKPDFQRKVKNIYHKSKASNEIKIEPKKMEKKKIDDYSTPLNEKFKPVNWLINYNTQLPEYVES